jgi:hypothetical protein
MASVGGFPDHVDEKAARTVAAGVGVTSVPAGTTGWLWFALPLAYGFLPRVRTGPTPGSLSQPAERAVAPRPRPLSRVAGPPTRLAQGIEASVAMAAAVVGAAGATP